MAPFTFLHTADMHSVMQIATAHLLVGSKIRSSSPTIAKKTFSGSILTVPLCQTEFPKTTLNFVSFLNAICGPDVSRIWDKRYFVAENFPFKMVYV